MTQHQEIWCQPADQPKRQFLVMFDDPQMDVAVFDDEAEARAYWEKANLNWTCYLMGTMPRSPSPQTNMLVKPLDWESSENVRLEWAESVVGQYRVHCGFEMDGKSYAPAFRFPGDSEWVTCASLEDAKDKAQEHYEARIRSALTPSPSSNVASLPQATDLEKLGGWTLSYDFLDRLQRDAEDATTYIAPLEAVEHIILAALQHVSALPQEQKTGLTDTQLLDALASNYWDLRCVDVPTGGDDADIDWIVIEHHQGKPSEVEVERAYADDPRLAIRRALRSADKNAARCVSCDEVLHDGDSVYYEHGEGGHIHSHCASEDPESFVDEDEVPLKAGDDIPEPFAYSVEKYEGQP